MSAAASIIASLSLVACTATLIAAYYRAKARDTHNDPWPKD